MDCPEARADLLDDQRGRLSAEARARLRAHLDGCAACARVEVEERVLTEVLESRVPQHPASVALKRRLAAGWPAATEPVRGGRGWRRSLAPALAAALVLAVAIPALAPWGGRRSGLGVGRMTAEAVNDHLRVLYAERPLEVRDGDVHQVKPWFSGRLDFAPAVRFGGDQDFPLQGGAVGYFLDRKAATFVYSRRRHTISLFVFRADGLPWPTRGLTPMGRVEVYAETIRGFNVLVWRDGELGHALVSDVDAAELHALATRIAGSA
jgi:anti-sigma factor RsiW